MALKTLLNSGQARLGYTAVTSSRSRKGLKAGYGAVRPHGLIMDNKYLHIHVGYIYMYIYTVNCSESKNIVLDRI